MRQGTAGRKLRRVESHKNFSTLSQKRTQTERLFGRLCKKYIFLLDKCIKINYDAAQDRGARFISKLLSKDAANPGAEREHRRSGKESCCASFRWADGKHPSDCHASGALSSTKDRARFPRGPQTEKKCFLCRKCSMSVYGFSLRFCRNHNYRRRQK